MLPRLGFGGGRYEEYLAWKRSGVSSAYAQWAARTFSEDSDRSHVTATARTHTVDTHTPHTYMC